jgi:hypothetical protein
VIHNPRDILNCANDIAKWPQELAMEGIRLYLQGEWTDTLQVLGFTLQKDMPEPNKEWIWLDGYWVLSKKPMTGYSVFKPEKINKLCPKCSSNFMAEMVSIACPKANPKGWRTRLECSNQECLYEEYSTDNKLIVVEQYGKVIF